MKPNVTFEIEAELWREARVLAAEEGSSTRALLAARLEQTVRERKGYHQAGRRAIAVCGEDLTCAGRLLAHRMNSMNDKCFVEANILVYAHGHSAGLKHQRAQTPLERHNSLQ